MNRPEVRAKALEMAVRSMEGSPAYTGYMLELALRTHKFAHYIAEDGPPPAACTTTCFYYAALNA